MNLTSFYNDFYTEFEKQHNNREAKSLIEIVSNGLGKEEVKKIRKAYREQNPETKEFIEKLAKEAQTYWQFTGKEFENIFFYRDTTLKDIFVINTLGAILGNQKHDTDRLPGTMRIIQEEKLITPKAIQPNIHESYPSLEECISSLTYHRYNTSVNLKFNSKILNRINKVFKKREKEKTSETSKISKTKLLAKPIGTTRTINRKNLIEQIRTEEYNSASGAIPLTNYGAILKLDPDTFTNKHALDMFLLLNMEFDDYTTMNSILEKDGFIKCSSIDGNKNSFIGTTDNYVLLATEEAIKTTSSPFNDRNYRIYAFKALLETYCKENNIEFYSESRALNSDKIKLLDKANTYSYSIKERDRISKQLNKETMIKLIDFIKHQYNVHTRVDDVEQCECGENIVFGKFAYHSDGGYISGEGVLELGLKRTIFPIENLHALAYHPDTYQPHIGEIQIIETLLELSKDWKPLLIPEKLTNDYIKILKNSYYVDKAAKETNEWMEGFHGFGNVTQEELEADPELKAAYEMDQEIVNRPQQIRLEVKEESEKILNYFQNEMHNLPKIHENQGDLRLENHIIGNSLAVDIYTTLRFQQALLPQPHLSEIVSKVESHKLLEEHKQNNTKEPTENLPLRNRRKYLK